MQATQEGLVPLKTWIKTALDRVIQECMGEPALEFVWVGDDAIDPLEQAQTLEILVSAGIKTREEARADLGLGAEGRRSPSGTLGTRYWGSITRITTSAGGSQRQTMRLRPGAGRDLRPDASMIISSLGTPRRQANPQH
jgi:hypothetical protein